MTPSKGANGAPTSRSDVQRAQTWDGLRARAYGHGAPVVVRGRESVTAHTAKGQPSKEGQSLPGRPGRQGRCLRDPTTEVRGMREADAVLGIIRDRGRRGLPLERVYRLLFNRELFLRAYGRIYRNAGALTPGATEETADGMSLAKIDAVIEALRFERYRWT